MQPRGYGVWQDRGSDRRVERDVIACAHCNRQVFLRPRTAPTTEGTIPATPLTTGANLPRPAQPAHDADLGGYCAMCDAHVCGPCADKGVCRPFLRRVEAAERRNELLRRIGVAA